MGEIYSVAPESYDFDYNRSRVTALQVCASSFPPFVGLAAGFVMSIDGVEQPIKGCHPLVDPHPYDIIAFGLGEKVLSINLHYGAYGGYFVLRAITIHSNKATYGPIGMTSGVSHIYNVTGYEWQGTFGKAVYAVDNIGINFQKC